MSNDTKIPDKKVCDKARANWSREIGRAIREERARATEQAEGNK